MAVKSLIKVEYSQFDWNEIIMIKPEVKIIYLIKDIKIINSKDLGKAISKIKKENSK